MEETNNLSACNDSAVIVAQCTPEGSGAIALIRVSGEQAVAIVDRIAHLSSLTTLSSASTHTIHHGYIIDPATSKRIDEVLFLLMRGPRTFTGQDTVEITCHNNQFIIQKIIELCIAHGALIARPGQFTQRSFLSGKIDLLQAEAINELIHATSEQALQISQAQLQGSLSNVMNDIEKKLLELLGLAEASFEFLDEEQRDLGFDAMVNAKLCDLITVIANIKQHFAYQRQIRQGIRVALVGSVNVGKSTLFNSLVGQRRAIVSDIAGTTRDSIQESRIKNGKLWLLVDTAGLRDTHDIVEQEGIARSYEQATQADVILLVLDATTPPRPDHAKLYQDIIEQEHQKIVLVYNKIDRLTPGTTPENINLSNKKLPTIHISAQHGTGIEQLESMVDQKIFNLFSAYSAPFLLNQRHLSILTEVEYKLKNIANSKFNTVHYELMAHELKEILESVTQLTGKNISERTMDTIFNEFCVGK